MSRENGFLSGLIFGGLVGAAIGLLMAPRTGDEMRQLLRDQSIQLRDRAAEKVEDTRARAMELQDRSREVLEQSKEKLARTADAVKRTAEETWKEGGNAATGPQTGV